MIDEEATYEKFGCYSSELSPKSGKKIVAVCDGCGKVRVVKKAFYFALCSLCSHSRKGAKSSRWKGGLVKRICENCGKKFPFKPSKIKRGGGKFCSPKCYGEWLSKHRRGENHPQWKGGKVKRICEFCGTEFPIKPSVIKDGRGKFCSRKCEGRWRSENLRGKNSPNWKNGASFEPYCIKFNNEFKEYIRDKFGRICFLCGKTEEENGKRLSVHHVNENKACGCDGDETCQFVPLCKNCHSKVHSKKVDWEKKINDKLRTKLNGWYI